MLANMDVLVNLAIYLGLPIGSFIFGYMVFHTLGKKPDNHRLSGDDVRAFDTGYDYAKKEKHLS